MGWRILFVTKRKYAVITLLVLIVGPVNLQFVMPPSASRPIYPGSLRMYPGSMRMYPGSMRMYPGSMPMYPGPMPPMPPGLMPGMFPYPHPRPMPIPGAIVAIIPSEEKETTTIRTTTTMVIESDDGGNVAVAIPVPVPVQIAVPGLTPPNSCQSRRRSPHCPPCPPCQCKPSCTPSFFSYCSACHLKCRCKLGDENPRPLPPIAPKPLLGPAYAMPVPIGVPIPPPMPPRVVVVPMPRSPPKCDSSSEYVSSNSCESN